MPYIARLELLGVREIDDPRYVAMHDRLIANGFRRVVPVDATKTGDDAEYAHLPHGTYRYDGEAADATAVRARALEAVAALNHGIGIAVFATTDFVHAGLMDAAPSDHRHEAAHRRDHGSAGR